MITPVSFLDNLLRILHAGRLGPHPAQCGRQLGISGLLVGVMLVIVMGGCGLPDYVAIGKPIAVSGPKSTCLAFETPADVSNINGYVIYYKVYVGDTDIGTQRDESYYFDENSYIDISSEMPIGPTLPLQRGFVKAGISGKNSYQTYHISDPALGAGATVYIDFDYGREQVFAEDSSWIPRIGFTYNPINEGVDVGDVHTFLARGVIDSGAAENSSIFLPFSKTGSTSTSSADAQWDWDSTGNQSHHDSDIFRNFYLPLPNDPGSFSDSMVVESSGTAPDVNIENDEGPMLKGSTGLQVINIGVVVYSQGLDPTILTTLQSKPTYIGTVQYRIYDADRNRN